MKLTVMCVCGHSLKRHNCFMVGTACASCDCIEFKEKEGGLK